MKKITMQHLRNSKSMMRKNLQLKKNQKIMLKTIMSRRRRRKKLKK